MVAAPRRTGRDARWPPPPKARSPSEGDAGVPLRPDPTPGQVAALASHCGAARFAFNWGLARIKAALSQRETEKSYGVPGEHLTEVAWSLYGLRRAWNTAKNTAAPWWAEHSKEAYTTGLDNLARALKNWAASRNGTRKGPKIGFPRFRSKHRTIFLQNHVARRQARRRRPLVSLQ
ncbi:helix-turn-helix domain-containing protein [Streptosporangium sp. NPDC023825]|uniref:helix-turn-helix domain-containing protein n=1 Tax=Streptosporangium sp. NPDC023825 TaxID=3154909 RepID=UPI003430910F